MLTHVLTVNGDDRPGLVRDLAATIRDRGGNWERSQLAELAGQFAGIVVVTVDDHASDDLRQALAAVDGLTVSVHAGAPSASVRPEDGDDRGIRIDLIGNDRPGIVGEISRVLAEHRLNVAELATATTEAPMAGGLLFEAHVVADLPADADPATVRRALEALATELMVDLTLDGAGA